MTDILINRKIVTASTSTVAESLCRAILSELQDEHFSQEDIFAVHLALEEAFLNAVKHGNKMDSRKKITIEYKICSDRIEVLVCDQGSGFDPSKVPDPRYGENLFKPDGRGIFLMRCYMDVIEFNSSGNCVQMVKYKQGCRPGN